MRKSTTVRLMNRLWLCHELLERQILLVPQAAPLMDARARLLARTGDWEEAGRQLDQLLEDQPNNLWARYRRTCLFLGTGNDDAYRSACSELLALSLDTSRPDIADRAARVCLLLPDAVGRPEVVEHLATIAMSGSPESPVYCYFALCGGMSHYRQGRYEQAAEWLTRSIDASKKRFRSCGPVAGYFLAMTRQQQGKQDRARQLLADAERHMRELRRDDPQTVNANWIDMLMCRRVAIEADELINGRVE